MQWVASVKTYPKDPFTKAADAARVASQAEETMAHHAGNPRRTNAALLGGPSRRQITYDLPPAGSGRRAHTGAGRSTRSAAAARPALLKNAVTRLQPVRRKLITVPPCLVAWPEPYEEGMLRPTAVTPLESTRTKFSVGTSTLAVLGKSGIHFPKRRTEVESLERLTAVASVTSNGKPRLEPRQGVFHEASDRRHERV
jgi:hypothetical protein